MCEYSAEALPTANNERHFPLKTGTSLSISIILGRYITAAISPTILYSPLCGLLLTFLPPHKLYCLTSGQCHFSASALSHKGDFTPGQAIRRCFCVLVTFILCWNVFTWQMTTENFPVLLRSTVNRRHKRLWYWFPGHLNRIKSSIFPSSLWHQQLWHMLNIWHGCSWAAPHLDLGCISLQRHRWNLSHLSNAKYRNSSGIVPLYDLFFYFL